LSLPNESPPALSFVLMTASSPMPSVDGARRSAVDLFAGAGGLTLGLMEAGFHVVGAVEIDPPAVATYATNHPKVRVWEADIRDVDPRLMMHELGLERGDLALLAGCAPCQGFSRLRTRNGRTAAEDDRNALVLEFGRFAREFEPRAIMMENVPAVANDPVFEELLEELEGLGYPVRAGKRVLNAADYGVPQRRFRLVVIAVRHGTVRFAAPTSHRRTVRDAIAGLDQPGSSGDALHDLREVRGDAVRRIIASIPHDGGGRLDLEESQRLPCHRNFNGFKDVYGRMAWDKVAPTITGGCHNPSKGRFLHPDQDRTITLREAALLQSFPPDYFISLERGKLSAAAMIGNALPPSFVTAHARELVKALDAHG
jgi:DNA (cytosine-5)-methyltransferase 1